MGGVSCGLNGRPAHDRRARRLFGVFGRRGAPETFPAAPQRFRGRRAEDNKGMSRQGEARDRQEDSWWQELYADPHPPGGPDQGGSLDDHVASAFGALHGGPPGQAPRRDGAAGRIGAPIPVPRRAPNAGPLPGRDAAEPSADWFAAADPAADPAGEPSADPAAEPSAAPSFESADGLCAAPRAEVSAWPVADPGALDGLVPDTVLDGLAHGPLTVRAVSTRGTAARRQGLPRTESVFTARFGRGAGELLLLAVAGGGPAARSACLGLAAAIGESSDRLAADVRAARVHFLKPGLKRLTDRACRFRPAGGGSAVRCLLLSGDPECRLRVFFGIGPGGLFRLRDGRWQDLDPAFAGAAAARHVFRFHAGTARPGDALVLCSEAPAAALRGEPEFGRMLADRWSPDGTPPGLADFLADAAAPVAGSIGDRSVVAVWDR